MVNIEQQMQSLQQKLQLLLKSYSGIQKENSQLKQELEKTRLHLVSAETKVAQLERQLAARSIVSPALQESEKLELQKRIDGYLKEIDKCLEILNA